jgi:uncharacterized protein (DUF885 family)
VFWRNLALSLLAAASASALNPPGDPILQLDERFVHATLALSPISATGQGYHRDAGRNLDELLDDYSASGMAADRKLFRDTLAETAKLRAGSLTPEARADLDVIELQCKAALLEIEDKQSYRHNPTIYVELIGSAVYEPFILDYAPAEQRLAAITARLEKIPSFLAVAKQNLESSPEVWNGVAREENEGNIALIDKTIRAKVPANLTARYDRAASTAIASLRQFNEFLRDTLSRHPAEWRLGPALYAREFALALATGDTPVQTLSDAERKLNEIRADMRKQATALYPRFFPNRPVPGDENTVIKNVLDKIALEHATPENYFAEARKDLREATEFVRRKQLLALPAGNNLSVIPTPEFMRGIYGVGGFSPAPILQPSLGAFYWITPVTPDMKPDQVESKLREYNRYGLEILTLHEAMPGHYVQAEYASSIIPKWRGVLRASFSNNPYVEGWAVYATQMMIEEGFDDTPEMRLTFGKQMLRVVANTILDVRLHTMNMTDAQAMDLMINQTFQEHEEAEKKLQRAKLSSCQLPTYFVGWRGWDRLRDSEKERLGSHFRLAAFHEAALKQGAVPLPVLVRLLGDQTKRTEPHPPGR